MDLNLEATELRLGLPGIPTQTDDTRPNYKRNLHNQSAPPTKAQVVGWPPVRSCRKNTVQGKKTGEGEGAVYVKVSMDGAPYLRKIDLGVYKDYPQLLDALQDMFRFTIAPYSDIKEQPYNCNYNYNNGSQFSPTYEDKDGDWMLLGDVPWQMFICSCRRMRIMKGSEVVGGLSCGV